MNSWYNGFWYPRMYDNIRMIESIMNEEHRKKYAFFLGVMNLWETKDEWIRVNNQLWENQEDDLVMDRDGNISKSKADLESSNNQQALNSYNNIQEEGGFKGLYI